LAALPSGADAGRQDTAHITPKTTGVERAKPPDPLLFPKSAIGARTPRYLERRADGEIAC
jgi:hypothetical protein